jgi:tetratricopeptide (TPR) repeat protein
LSKRRHQKQRRARPTRSERPQRRRSRHEFQEALEQAHSLIDRDQASEAIKLLEPFLASYPRAADLHGYLGCAHVVAGNIWAALASYERAMELSREPGYWLPLASLYMDLEWNAHALQAFRQVLRHELHVAEGQDVRGMIAHLEASVQETAQSLQIPAMQVEKGLRYLEIAQRALQAGDYAACVAANRQSVRLLGYWPPPHNNLSLALFLNGQPEEAIAVARQVLARDPYNIHALANAIRFLAWTGREEEARALWVRLKDREPQDERARLKMAESAAVLEEDEQVYALLEPLDKQTWAKLPGLSEQIQLHLAVAEANLGKAGARRRLQALRGENPWVSQLLAALDAGRPGPGWAERFPYFQFSDLISRERMDQLVELLGREGSMPPDRFRRLVESFAAQFPSVVLAAEKLIWEESQPEAGIGILKTVATPAAFAALRRFGLSQAGDDEIRHQALFALSEAGQIAAGETLRVWSQGEWREVQLRGYEIHDERRTEYALQVADLLDQGEQALRQDDQERAERLFRRALKLEPRAVEAYNNLGTIYARRQDHTRAKEMFHAALEIDPLYVLARCNLALYVLDEGDPEAAQAMLAPLADRPGFRSLEMAFYSYTQARILIERKDYDAARKALQMALQVWPDYGPAKTLLSRLETVSTTGKGFRSFFERQRKRDKARRARLQAKLSTPDPSLSEALALYSKEALGAMGHVVLRWGGWSTLHKAELAERIAGELQEVDNVARIVTDLDDTERGALRRVLAWGGTMPWADFDAEYGSDLQESQYWQWHVPRTRMGRLRLRGLLVETTVEGALLVAIPLELRPIVAGILG